MHHTKSDPEKYLAECLRIDPLTIEDEFIRVPADLAYWNERYSETYQCYHEAKLSREALRQRLFKAHGDRLRSTTTGRVTIAEIEAETEGDDEFLFAKSEEITADAERIRLAGIMDALRSKRDMLISLGAHMRATMGNDPMIRKQAALEREVASP